MLIKQINSTKYIELFGRPNWTLPPIMPTLLPLSRFRHAVAPSARIGYRSSRGGYSRTPLSAAARTVFSAAGEKVEHCRLGGGVDAAHDVLSTLFHRDQTGGTKFLEVEADIRRSLVAPRDMATDFAYGRARP